MTAIRCRRRGGSGIRCRRRGGTAGSGADVAVLRFGDRRVPRALAGLPVYDVLEDVAASRVIVLGTHADLSALLTRLLRTDRLDVEVAFLPRSWHARRARTGTARRVPLIRDETGTVITKAALWLPPDETKRTVEGEAVVDDTVLFDSAVFGGRVTGVRIEPTTAQPGLRACVLTSRMRPRRWVTGRAAQLGTTGALVVRDGTPTARPVKRSTFYRHTQGWLKIT